MTLKDELILEEYKTLRESIKNNIQYIEENEKNAVILLSAIYSAAFIQQSVLNTYYFLICAIPIFVSVVGLIRYKSLDRVIGVANDYLQQLEGKFPDIGWTTFYRNPLTGPNGLLGRSRDTFWWVLIIGTTIIFVLLNLLPFIKIVCNLVQGFSK